MLGFCKAKYVLPNPGVLTIASQASIISSPDSPSLVSIAEIAARSGSFEGAEEAMGDVNWIIDLVKVSSALSMESPRWASACPVEIRRILLRSFLAEAELSGRASGSMSWFPVQSR
jgi:hypothetical protein